MISTLLENLGLTRPEVRVFQAICELGLTSTGPLSEKSQVATSNIYRILNSLCDRGLISYTTAANRRLYRVADRKSVLKIMADRRAQLDRNELELSEYLAALPNPATDRLPTSSFTYQGLGGIKSALEEVLSSLSAGDTFYVLDSSKISNEKLMPYFNEFHKRRVKKRIKYRVLFGRESLIYAEERKGYRLTKVRILPRSVSIPTVFWIYGDRVTISVYSRLPVAMVIDSPEVAEGFMAHFSLLWGISRSI